MLKSFFSTAFLASLLLASESALADWPNTGDETVPKARLLVHVELEDGSVLKTHGAILRDGVSGNLYARHASSASELRVEAVDRGSDQSSPITPRMAVHSSPSPVQGYWTTHSVVGRRGRVIGHEHVWMHYCQNCGRYHQ